MNVHQEISKIRAFRERNGNDGEIKSFVNMFREGQLSIDVYSHSLCLIGLDPDECDETPYFREQMVIGFSGKAGFKQAYRLARLITR
ncbi:hypothetical protein MIB43_015270 [Providencia rettgeri]|uniref:hypothetical protein n=1 Tax=Providencia rettgeri TaxID=587 RepID=UPI001F04B434|nr:hypothetical protein [Providencia rettgeri]MCG9951278.1 hypothetical protein [Providencia rettgeri]